MRPKCAARWSRSTRRCRKVGYILSEDPTYITTHNNARSLVRRIDRDELLQILVKDYLGVGN